MTHSIQCKSTSRFSTNILKIKWLFFFVVTLTVCFFVLNYIASEKNPWHLELENCQNCHIAQGEINATNAHFLVVDQELLCKRCHEDSISNSHPSGLIPAGPISPPFTVDWKGELTCSSCHFVHEQFGRMNRSNKKGKKYCLECHNDVFFESMLDKGISLIGFGHLDASPDDDFTLIDRFSFQCITCHSQLDGILNVAYNNRDLIQHDGRGGSHPIGRVYREAARYGGYKQQDFLNPLIELPDGKVGCTSCHDGYSQYHGKLVIEMAGSKLCLECHNQ